MEVKQKNKWSLIKTFENKNFPSLAATSMESHNGYLYLGLTGKGSSLYRMQDDI